MANPETNPKTNLESYWQPSRTPGELSRKGTTEAIPLFC